MKIVDLAALARFRTRGPCERCGIFCRRREPHHVFTRGAGRLDIAINLVALGSSRLRLCLSHHDAAKIGRAAFLLIVAKREGLTVDWIVDEIYRLRRLSQPRLSEREEPLVKQTKVKTAWQEKAGELRRARARASYRWWKEKRRLTRGPSAAE